VDAFSLDLPGRQEREGLAHYSPGGWSENQSECTRSIAKERARVASGRGHVELTFGDAGDEWKVVDRDSRFLGPLEWLERSAQAQEI
jgi:hypothetical protein